LKIEKNSFTPTLNVFSFSKLFRFYVGCVTMFKIGAILLLITVISSCGQFSALSKGSSGTHLGYNKRNLNEVPQEVFLTENLTSLSLFGNHLTALPDSITKLAELEVLYLGKNEFVTFPEQVCYLKNLKILSIAYNDLDSLPDCIGNLEKLEMLILNNNQIEFLPDSVSNLKNLMVLNLNRNNLRTLPNGIYELDSLQTLNLGVNNIDSLSVLMANWVSLKELRLVRSGPLLRIPDELCDLRFLELLEIDQSIVLPTCALARVTSRLRIQVVEF
jgi:Leucine-rich repeat (LRR) protein